MPERRRVTRTHNTEKALLAEIEALKERIDSYEMSIFPEMNADRIWRRIVDIVGHNPGAGELAIKTGERLAAIGKGIIGDIKEWDAARGSA